MSRSLSTKTTVAIWELAGRLDLRRYHEQIAAVEGIVGREHTDPRLLISMWLYTYSQGISSARELARQCEYEPGCHSQGAGFDSQVFRFATRLTSNL